MTDNLILQALFAALTLFVVYYGLWKPLLVEGFKHYVSRHRDRLFDYWYENNLPLDNFAYNKIMSMCSYLQDNAHDLTIFRLGPFIDEIGKSQSDLSDLRDKLLVSIKELSDDARGQLIATGAFVFFLFIKKLALDTPIVGCFLLAIYFYSRFKEKSGLWFDRLKQQWVIYFLISMPNEQFPAHPLVTNRRD